MSAWPLLIVWLAACGWLDIRTRRIPNGLTVLGLLAGLILQTGLPPGSGLFQVTDPGAIGISRAGVAAAFMFVASLALWRLRVFGAGDAKMLIAIAAWVGPPGVLPVLLLSLCAGGLLAMAAVIWRKLVPGAPRNTAAPPGKGALGLPYSLAIMAGTLGYIALVRSGLWGP